MLDLDNSQISEEDKKAFAEIDHFDELKAEQGYDTVWSIETGIKPLDHAIFTNKPRLVKYKVIKEMGATFADVPYQTFECMAENGTIGGLWRAAEACFKQAKLELGDWHYFIEDFEVQEDGSLSLVTGS